MRKVELIVEYLTDEEQYKFKEIKGELIRCRNCLYCKQKEVYDKYTEDPCVCEYWNRGTSNTGHCERAICRKRR